MPPLGSFSSASDFFSSSDVRSAVQQAADGFVFVQERGFLSSAFDSAAKFCSWVFDLIKFDAFITFFQEIALWFKSFEFPALFSDVFRSFVDFCSLVWSFVLGITDLQLFYMWGVLTALLFVVWLVQKRYDPLAELTGPNTYSWAQRGKVWYYWTYLLIMLLTTLYLPTITACFNVMFCFKNLMVPYELVCYEGVHWVHFAVSVFIFLFVGMYFPFQVFVVIRKYQPKPHMYDDLGHLMDRKDDEEQYLRQYRDLLSRDTCPYGFIYAGYEYGWSLYKVITMIFKVILIIPTIPFFTSSIGSASASLVIMALYGLTSIVSSPFLLPSDDWIEMTARVTAVLTIAIQICVMTDVIYEPISSYFLISLNIINLVVMCLIVVGNLTIVQNFIRRHFGKLKYTKDLKYNNADSRKKRIWKRFWNSILTSKEELTAVASRLQEMTDVFSEIGESEFSQNLIPPFPEIAQARRMAQFFEGPDCYYKGKEEMKNYWGRMYITPFPFELSIVYDDSQKIIILDNNNIIDFVNQNKDKEITLGRKFRQMIRCLHNERVKFNFEEFIKVKNCCGTDDVLVKFSTGILKVLTRANDPFVHGFRVKLYLDDGIYTDISGKVHKNYEYCLSRYDLGITPLFNQTPELLQLLTNNKEIIEAKWDSYMQRLKWMRDDLEEERREKTDILSESFFMFVYNNDKIPKEEMFEFIKTIEKNPVVHKLVEENEPNFEGLYSRLKYYDLHPAISFWYNFFDDIFVRNSQIKQIEENKDLFDMSLETALAYHPMEIAKLKEELVKRKLRSSSGEGLFNDKVMNLLEERMNQECGGSTIPLPTVHVEMIDAGLLADTLCLGTPLMTENTTYLASAAMTAFLG